jgi:hypothetical protein
MSLSKAAAVVRFVSLYQYDVVVSAAGCIVLSCSTVSHS